VEDSSQPIWYTEYVNTKDLTPFVLHEVTSETSSMTDGIYCIDQNITGDGRSVEYCQKAWLLDKSNPYANLSWYTSIESIIPPCNTLKQKEKCLARKNDPGDCRWHHHKCTNAPDRISCLVKHCQVEWLEETSFPIGRPCRPFWEYCRGYNPSLYQCDQFWDYCKKRLDTDHPGWTYPKESCKDPRISNETITTCQIKWLEYKENPYDPLQSGETCYTFWNYCRDELERKYANWTYPIDNSYCENNPSLTCKVEWLGYDTYDEWVASDSSLSNDETCRSFFDYCRLQLKARYPRYVWPFVHPPTVDDLMPGRCCLDTPVETDVNSEFWGSHVSMILILV